MKSVLLSSMISLSLLFFCSYANSADELYILTIRDGSAVVVRDYRFTDQYIEFTTEEGLPGFIKRSELVRIDNMIGVPDGEGEPSVVRSDLDNNVSATWVFSVILLVLLFCLMLFLLRRKKTTYSRREKEQKTGGHLAFDYKEALGRISSWTIEVRRAYEEGGILYVEGVCTVTDKKKKFRADKVVGPVTDMSNEQKAPMEKFFIDA